VKAETKYGYYWFIVILLLIATSLSFLDRQVLSVTILKIKEKNNYPLLKSAEWLKLYLITINHEC